MNINIINSDEMLFGVHLQSVKNALVLNYKYSGNKDGFHINGGCENIIIDGFDISSFDDAFGIMTDDFPRVQHNFEDIKNIIIKNGISRERSPQTGFFIRFLTGSWSDWRAGNKFDVGHTTKVNNIKYKKINDGVMISEECPVHLSGDSLYSDGIVWRYLDIGNNYTSNIYNVYVSEVNLEDKRKIVRTVDDSRFNHSEYYETENSSIVDGLYIEDHRIENYRGKIGYVKIYRIEKYFPYFISGIIFLLIIIIAALSSYLFKENLLNKRK